MALIDTEYTRGPCKILVMPGKNCQRTIDFRNSNVLTPAINLNVYHFANYKQTIIYIEGGAGFVYGCYVGSSECPHTWFLAGHYGQYINAMGIHSIFPVSGGQGKFLAAFSSELESWIRTTGGLLSFNQENVTNQFCQHSRTALIISVIYRSILFGNR